MRDRWHHFAIFDSIKMWHCFCWAEGNHPIGEEVDRKPVDSGSGHAVTET